MVSLQCGTDDNLQSQELVAKLGRCKQTAREIESRVAESEKMSEKIESTRKKYLPVSAG